MQHQKDLNQLRDLRKQLKAACKFTKAELDSCKVRVAKDEVGGSQTDSSDEDNMSRADMAFNKGAIKGIGNALKEAPKNFIEGFADLLLNPVSTVEGIIGFLETLPEMPGHIFEYLETIEGDEEAKGEKIAKFITEQLLTLASPNKVKLLQKASKTKLGLAAVKVAEKGVLEMQKIAKYVNKIPKNWIKQPSKKGGGIKYVNPKNSGDYIRFSPPNLDSRAPGGQQVPYFERLKDGKYLTKEGKWVRPTGLNKEDYHIPQTIFDNLEHVFDF